ncbi:TIGR04255 family protein [Leptolyngbya sp. AN02str]|uniref:TIGR04255 family protein n=1 Tax=Leptolyngbya sp. AN02str TaxID=3423363 RepID=UPI003D31FAE2
MTKAGPYTKAPITEALIDFRVELPPEVEVTNLKSIQSDIQADYPRSEDLITFQSQIQTGPDFTTTASHKTVGCRFLSDDRKQVLQARLDGFAFSRLAPYSAWEPFRNEAKKLWQVYSAVAQPSSIKRVAVRYINRLDLPLPLEDFKDYLRTFPELSPDLSQDLADYVMQVIIPERELDSWLMLQEGVVPTPSGVSDVVSIALDITLFREPQTPIAEEDAWELLERFRIRKNDVFEACITNKTRSLFK